MTADQSGQKIKSAPPPPPPSPSHRDPVSLVQGLLTVIKKHEDERPGFWGTEDYTEEDWNAITDAVVFLRDKERRP